MKITVVTDIGSFGALRDEWNALLSTTNNDTPFLRWEWTFHYYEHMCKDQTLFLLLVRDNREALRGIAPFVLRERRIITRRVFLEFIGQNYSYYLDIIANDESGDDVAKEVVGYLFENRRRWDLINLVHLSDDAKLKTHLKTYSNAHRYCWRESIQDPCKVVKLPTSFDEYILSLDKHFSQTLKRSLRRMERDFDVELSVPEDAQSLMLLWHRFMDLHIERIQDKESTTILSNKDFQEFYFSVAQAMFREHNPCLIALRFDKQIAGVLFGITWKNTFYFVNIGYKKFSRYSLAVVLPVLCIERSIMDGLAYFDALGGGGDYKEKMGGVDRGGIKIQVLKPMPLLENMAKNMARKILNRRMLDKAKNVIQATFKCIIIFSAFFAKHNLST